MKPVKTSIAFGISFLLFCVVQSCKNEIIKDSDSECAQSVEERGNRRIALDILDPSQTGDFEMNHELAVGELKSDFIQLLQPWNAFENLQAGIYDGEGIQLFEMLNDFAGYKGSQLSLIIAPIDIPGRFLPAYLSDKKFNDPLVIESFKNLIDRLFNHANGVINPEWVMALSVGNEIDHYNWAVNQDQVSEYKEFLQAIKTTINAYGIPLHFTGTLYGLIQPGNDWIDLAEVVDRVSVTYYPINSDYTVKSSNVVISDINTLATKFTGKELFIQEIGYPSSAYLNSNEEKQAEFFCHFFEVWDTHQDQIIHASILRLNDVSTGSAEATAEFYGATGNNSFVEYIRTLGIRTWENQGRNKKAFETIAKELERRDW